MLIACITKEDLRILDAEQVKQLRFEEQMYYKNLKEQEKLHTYYIQAASRGNVLIFDVDSVDEMHRLLLMGPLAMYQTTEVYPLMTLPALGDLPGDMVKEKI